MKRRTGLIICLVILIIGISSGFGWRWWSNRGVFTPESLGATATLRLVDQATADAALRPVIVESAGPGDQIFLGQVSWQRPPGDSERNQFQIVVLDKRSRLMPEYIAVKSSGPGDVGTGYNYSIGIAAERYPWLEGAEPRETNGTFWDSGGAIVADSTDTSPITFAVVLRARNGEPRPENRRASAPVAAEDLMVALVNSDRENRLHWAQRLLN